MRKNNIAVIGASGYSGEELIRILLRHPYCNVRAVTSRSYKGRAIGEVFPRFAESELKFTEPDVNFIAEHADIAVLALPHGVAADFAVPLLDAGVRVVDISADFRLKNAAVYKQYYEREHPAPELLNEAVYGLPEKYRADIKNARLIACPGCYPTSVLLPLLPLVKGGLIDPENIIANSLSGVTGAGRKTKLPFLFAECNESIRPYAVTSHRHLPEIEQELTAADDSGSTQINFIPHLVPVNRGIHSTIVTELAQGKNSEDIYHALKQAYEQEPFVRLLNATELADTKHVTFTNMNEIGYAYDARTERLILSSAIDNLTKGAAGQAVQCINIMTGVEETSGLT